MIGKTIGPFEIEAELGPSRWGPVYRASQRGVQRTVALKTVSPEIAGLPGRAEHFLEEMRASARIIHEHIAAFFEAGQADGVHFCAMEYLDGPPLPEFLRGTDGVDEHHLLQAIAGVAAALDFLWQKKIPHQPVTAEHILTDHTGQVKLINVLPFDEQPVATPKDDLLALGLIVAHLANEIGPVRKPVGELVERMVGAGKGKAFASLAELAVAAGDLDRELFPPTSAVEPAIGKIQPKKRQPWVPVVIGVVALGLAIGLVWWLRRTTSAAPVIPRPADFATMVEVKAEKPFLVDRYEVTIGEYKQFLDAIASGVKVPEHTFAGRNKDHTPANWNAIVQSIERRAALNGVLLTWDSPVFAVDWYDAYSYAGWKKKRLPTDEEFAQILKGLSPLERSPQWAAVYADARDRTSAGIAGLAGGVSEWSGTTIGRDRAVACGGSWKPDMSWRIDLDRDTRSDAIGFRCAADKVVKK